MNDVIRCRGTRICATFVLRDSLDATIYYISAGMGEIFECRPQDSSRHTSLMFTGGLLYGTQLDQKGCIHVADCARAVVPRVDNNGQPGVMVKAGPLGEATLEKLRGSIFSICVSHRSGKVLQPLAFECLAHPCGIAVSSADPKVLFVAEMMQNRILRLCRRPSNTQHLSVFHQFAGGLGPSCVACDKSGTLFVGHYDFAGGSAMYGKISVLSTEGVLQYTLQIPGAKITEICLNADQSFVVVTEASNSAIHRFPVR